MSVALGIGAALAAGSSFAAASVLQQRVAARVGGAGSPSARTVRVLARHPSWRAGVALAALSFGLQAFALSEAPLAIVQPVLVTELIVAIPVSARLAGHRLRAREWAALGAVAGGIAAVVWGGAAETGGTGAPLRWAIGGGALVIAALALAVDGRTRHGRTRGPLGRATRYAAGAALLDAFAAALLAATVAGFAANGVTELARPAPYAMAAANIGGFVLVQAAFQSGPLAVTMPMMDWLQPLVAVVLGVEVLGESIGTGAVHLTALALGAVAALAGVIALDTSPRVRGALAGPAPDRPPDRAVAQAVAGSPPLHHRRRRRGHERQWARTATTPAPLAPPRPGSTPRHSPVPDQLRTRHPDPGQLGAQHAPAVRLRRRRPDLPTSGRRARTTANAPRRRGPGS